MPRGFFFSHIKQFSHAVTPWLCGGPPDWLTWEVVGQSVPPVAWIIRGTGKKGPMIVKIQVSGVDVIKAGPKNPTDRPYAFGMEAAPASCSQVFKVGLNGAAVSPGQVIEVAVRNIGESKGSIWVRGDVKVLGAHSVKVS